MTRIQRVSEKGSSNYLNVYFLFPPPITGNIESYLFNETSLIVSFFYLLFQSGFYVLFRVAFLSAGWSFDHQRSVQLNRQVAAPAGGVAVNLM